MKKKNEELIKMINEFHEKAIKIIKEIGLEDKKDIQVRDIKKIGELEKDLDKIRKEISKIKEFM